MTQPIPKSPAQWLELDHSAIEMHTYEIAMDVAGYIQQAFS